MAKTSTEKDPELEINAKWSGPEFWKEWGKDKKDKKSKDNSSGGALYFVGFIGALFYYIQAADNFGEVLIGIAQSLIWPAIVVYKLLEGFYGIA